MRDFMLGEQLPFHVVAQALEDASEAGFQFVRLYGGEPLLHPDIAKMVRQCRTLDLTPYITTNAVLLGDKIDELFEAGLRDLTIGFYGVGQEYDTYVQRQGSFKRVEHSIATVRKS
jgi:cyclic pyranopterin phosphate synthase